MRVLIQNILFFVLWFTAGTSSDSHSRASPQHHLCQQVFSKDCVHNYVATKDEVICGTDGIQYQNFCYYAKARCQHNIQILHIGPCFKATMATPIRSSGVKVISAAMTSVTSENTPFKTTAERPASIATREPQPTMDTLMVVFCSSKDSIQCPNQVEWICGSNGRLYRNRCVFSKARCLDLHLTIVGPNNCKQSTTTTSKPSTTLDPLLAAFCASRNVIVCSQEGSLICGSDGRLYQNKCEYSKAYCLDPSLITVSRTNCGMSTITESSPPPPTTTTAPAATTVPTTQKTFSVIEAHYCQHLLTHTCGQGITEVFCGSDGHFYPNRCELSKANCLNPSLVIMDKSRCLETIGSL